MKFSLGKLFSNDKAVWALSFLLAVICWFVVALTVDTETNLEVKNVPVNINGQTSALSSLELHAIDGDSLAVSVHINGERLVVGGVDKSDITIVADLSGVTGPGSVDIPLTAVNNSGKDFSIVSVSPSVVTVKFDRLLTRTLPVTANINGLTVAEDYVVETETVTPDSVTISGPEIDVNKVDRCVVNVDVNDKLDKPTVFRSSIVLLDADGNAVESSYITTDVTEAEVVVPVKKVAELPLTIGFTNVPSGFPLDQLSYTLSNSKIKVAGIPDVLEKYSEISLGYVDMKTLDFSGNYNFDVTLPNGFTNVDNIESVEVRFDETNIGESRFTLKNFTIKNRPADYDITVTTTRLANVRVLGDKNVLATLSSDDIIAEVDLSDRNIQPGQFSVPLKIYMPTKGLVWAVGDYTVIINVKEA